MFRDRYDYHLTTSSAAAQAAYLDGADRLLSAGNGIDAAFLRAVEADDGFALGHASLARALQVVGRGREAKEPMARARALAAGATAREQSQIDILGKIIDGQGAAALEAIRRHVVEWPRDAMALAPATSVFGLIGFSGKAGRESDQLALLEPLGSAYGDDWWYRMALAFAECELQLHERCRRNIEASLAMFPRNAHAAHIRAHLYYELGERREGLAYLTDWARDYPRDGHIHCHVNWHIALWAMETGDSEQAWRVYHTALHPDASWGPQINVLTDCASFLFRAELAGGSRRPDLWRDLSSYAETWFPASGVAFADVHSALCHAISGDGAALAKFTGQPNGPAGDMVAPAARAFAAFARQDWATVIAELQPIMATHERLGGSRAQRDLIEYTLTAALLRAGRGEDAHLMLLQRRPQNGSGGFPIAGMAASVTKH